MAKRDDVPGLGEKLKAAREAAGITQLAASESSGVSRVNISTFESGTKTPTLATLYKLAAAYGVNVCDLLPGGMYDGKPVPPVAEPEPEAPAKKARRKR